MSTSFDCDDDCNNNCGADPCPDCDLVFCRCDDPHRCDECDTWGEFQCSEHGAAYIEIQRADFEHHVTLDALRTIVASPDAHDTEAWRAVVQHARAVLADIDPPSECDDREPLADAEAVVR